MVVNVQDGSCSAAVTSAIDRYIRRKMVFNKKDEIGFVTFGRTTRNDLADASYYRYVAVKQPLRTADVNMLRGARALFEEAAEDVVDDEGAEIADVRGGVDGRAAVIETENAVGVRGAEFAGLPRERVEKLDGHERKKGKRLEG